MLLASQVLGPVVIGAGSKIGAGSVVVSDIPAHSVSPSFYVGAVMLGRQHVAPLEERAPPSLLFVTAGGCRRAGADRQARPDQGAGQGDGPMYVLRLCNLRRKVPARRGRHPEKRGGREPRATASKRALAKALGHRQGGCFRALTRRKVFWGVKGSERKFGTYS